MRGLDVYRILLMHECQDIRLYVPPAPNDCGLAAGGLWTISPPPKQQPLQYLGFRLWDEDMPPRVQAECESGLIYTCFISNKFPCSLNTLGVAWFSRFRSCLQQPWHCEFPKRFTFFVSPTFCLLLGLPWLFCFLRFFRFLRGSSAWPLRAAPCASAPWAAWTSWRSCLQGAWLGSVSTPTTADPSWPWCGAARPRKANGAPNAGGHLSF